ncbi:FkbM family methyltransferase [Phragmitibacter flavus]|uniref:FkbM family methyltransferase n=1 Tax=Phragmitibacter flavus TaxID=2576071 RepID=A0A5R8KF14_9BACT|nr:FkbM family methyltransferase [Phragmitibacter flavus]TLD70896.1 FkbM family methyltransferase [Phragmitibacter flavus]
MLNSLKTYYRLKRSDFLSQLRLKILGPNVTGLMIKSQNGTIVVDPEDVGVGWELAKNGVYGQDLLDALLPLIGPESKVLVAGAHVGSLAIPLAKVAAEVTAFEANPNTYRYLELNRQLNQSNNLTLIPLALGSSSGTLQFLLSRVNSGGSKRLPKQAHIAYYSDKPEVVDVAMTAADETLPDATFDLIIMDIEGSEADALKGMPNLLSRAKYLFIEYLPHHLDLVAGVTDEEFVALLSPHFFTAKHHGSDLTGQSPNLLPFFKSLRELGGGDVLMTK